MSKPLSIRQLAMAVTESMIADIKADVKCEDQSYQKDALRLRFSTWIEKVTTTPMAQIDQAIADGTMIEITMPGRVGDVTREHLPGDLRIVKEFHNSASSSALVDMHDRKCTRVPFDKLFTPSLFPKLDYDEVRKRELVLGENGRVAIQDATQESYRLHDRIQKANFEAQRNDYEEYRKSKMARDRLFRRFPHCKTTDDLMVELGVWK